MLANNKNTEEEDTVEDEGKDLDTESGEANSVIQARAACRLALLNK